MIIWFTGLSGSGKTTLSKKLQEILEGESFSVLHVDGDIFREKKKAKNIFSRSEILTNNYSIISHCKPLIKKYDFIIVSVISPFQETREKAKKIFGKDYVEIFLNCPIEELLNRDTKNLYKKAIAGEIDNLIGFSKKNQYEIPQNSDLVIDTSKENISESIKKITNLIKPWKTKKKK